MGYRRGLLLILSVRFPTTCNSKICFQRHAFFVFTNFYCGAGRDTNSFYIMYCKNCGAEVNGGAAVCLKCGVRVGDGNKFCPNCGAQPDPLATVCVNCGVTLKGAAGGNESVVNSFGGAISKCFKHYADFSGRANRPEFWYFYLFGFLVGLLSLIPIIGWIIALGMIIPNLAVGVRRLHDIGKSGWNYLFCLIPLVGTILLIVWFCQPSQEGENKYGPNPNF